MAGEEGGEGEEKATVRSVPFRSDKNLLQHTCLVEPITCRSTTHTIHKSKAVKVDILDIKYLLCDHEIK